MAVIRHNPDIGYVSGEAAAQLGLTQIVHAGDFLFLSGVAPVHEVGGVPALLHPNDYRAQLRAVLDTIACLLATQEATMSDVVSITVFARDVSEYLPNVDVIHLAFGANLPTSTLVEVSALFFPEQLVEVTATAYRPAGREF